MRTFYLSDFIVQKRRLMCLAITKTYLSVVIDCFTLTLTVVIASRCPPIPGDKISTTVSTGGPAATEEEPTSETPTCEEEQKSLDA
ncbi:hypothetical protein ACTXT7_006504 [Hymenolepis weldensis]